SHTATLSNHLRDSGQPRCNPENRVSHSSTSNAAMYLVETKTMEYMSIATTAIARRNHDDEAILREDQRLRFIASNRKMIDNRPPQSSTPPFKQVMLQRFSTSNCRRRLKVGLTPSYQ